MFDDEEDEQFERDFGSWICAARQQIAPGARFTFYLTAQYHRACIVRRVFVDAPNCMVESVTVGDREKLDSHVSTRLVNAASHPRLSPVCVVKNDGALGAGGSVCVRVYNHECYQQLVIVGMVAHVERIRSAEGGTVHWEGA